jgi:oxygen-dependent protoporphyrinogen oxidase
LSGNIRTGVAVRRITRGPGGFKVDLGKAGSLHAKTVIIATQAHIVAQLIDDLDPMAAAAAAQITAPPMAVVFFGFPRRNVDHPLNGLGFLTSEKENRNILGAQFCSTMFPGRAPENHIAVSAYVGGARSPDIARLPARDLIDIAGQEFRDLIGAKGDPVVAQVRHWPCGLPQYGAGHKGLVDVLGSTDERQAGLFLTGNYFSGPSVANCLGVALNTASTVHRYLKKTTVSRQALG